MRRRRNFFLHRFGRPGPPGKCLRDRFSADLVFLCAAGAAGRQFFSDQVVARLKLHWAPARPAGSL